VDTLRRLAIATGPQPVRAATEEVTVATAPEPDRAGRLATEVIKTSYAPVGNES
jgi:hypothetical protein